MPKNIGYAMRFFTIWLNFKRNFGDKIEGKTDPKPKIAKIEKPYKTLAGAAKIELRASEKR